MSPARAKHIAVGAWTYAISARPRLTLKESVGRNGAVVIAHWYDPRARGGKGAPRTKSTGISVRFPDGHKRAGQVWAEREQEVIKVAQEWHADLVAGSEPGSRSVEALSALDNEEKATLSIRGGFTEYTHVDSGRYRLSDKARSDIIRAGNDCVAALGEDATWATLNPVVAAEKIWAHVHGRFKAGAAETERPTTDSTKKRNKLRRKAGKRKPTDGAVWAERVTNHFFACAAWLKKRDHIPGDSRVLERYDDWQSDFRDWWRKNAGRDLTIETEGPRHSEEEAGRILEHIDDPRIDGRLRLNILFGGDSLRAGQVARAMRTHLDLRPGIGAFGLGRLTVLGSGKKKGSVVDLEPDVRAQIDGEMTSGYLRECELAFQEKHITDYALMPAGKFVKGATPVRPDRKYLQHISTRRLREFFDFLEDIAGVEHVHGRGWYGLRRIWTDMGDSALKTKRAKEMLSGHARGSTVPERIYRTKEDEQAIQEAARGRAAIREALRAGTVSEVSLLRVEAIRAINSSTDLEALRAVLQLLGVTPQGSDEVA